jgi:hypothetical protein
MSFRDAARAQHLGPERLKPAQGPPILDPSVEADERATDLCTGRAPRDVARERILAWLAEGAREVTWALCWLPRERWAVQPPVNLGDWPALRHVQHVAFHETHRILPAVRQALGETTPESSTRSALEIEQPDPPSDTADNIVRGLAETRFELLQRLEAAPDDAWQQPVDLDWLLLSARQHELQHLAAVWRIALNWGRDSKLEKTPRPGVPLHPADRLEESH